MSRLGWIARLFGIWWGMVSCIGLLWLFTQWLANPNFWIVYYTGQNVTILHYELSPLDMWVGIGVTTVGFVALLIQFGEMLVRRK